MRPVARLFAACRFAVPCLAVPAAAALATGADDVAAPRGAAAPRDTAAPRDAAAAKGAAKDVEPLMAVRGKPLLADDFAAPSLDPRWQVAKGKWAVADGALKGVQVEADMHAAVVRAALPHGDAIYQFDFRFDGGTGLHLSVNAAKGHQFRVTIAPTGFQVRKDGSKTDEADKAALLDSCRMTFEPGRWYTMTVEACGQEVLARVDDRHYAFGADAKLAGPRANLGFPVTGDAVSVDNVKVWAATPSPGWPAAKAKLAAAHPERSAEPARPRKAAAPK